MRPHWSQSVAPIVGAVTALAALGALLFTGRQVQVAQQAQITDRFTKAVEQLNKPGPENAGVRLGAVYSLERIMRDSSSDQPTVVDILAVFVRRQAVPPSPAPVPPASALPRGPEDIQAALTVLGRRDSAADRRGIPLDLRGAYLAGMYLADADLAGAYLTGTDLTGSVLDRADLRGAHLDRAVLNDVFMDHADLTDAFLPEARLIRTSLAGADLAGAYLGSADLHRAYLVDANLVDARLDDARMVDVNLAGADLARANFRGTDLTDAGIQGARGLTTEQLRCAKLTDTTVLPTSVPRPLPEAAGSLYCE